VQFVQQMPEVGAEAHGFRTKILLQTFADGITDRSAGLVIDLSIGVVDEAIHDEFRFGSV
jgi:hypothetical protein